MHCNVKTNQISRSCINLVLTVRLCLRLWGCLYGLSKTLTSLRYDKYLGEQYDNVFSIDAFNRKFPRQTSYHTLCWLQNLWTIRWLGNAKQTAQGLKSCSDEYLLSWREIQCIYFYMQEVKNTGEFIFLSPRTVEFYINNIKRKLCCRRKAQVMVKIAQSDFSSQLWQIISSARE